jgi:tricorn protease-like protein
MLQWHPNESNNCIVYNKLVSNQYGSVVFDIFKNKIIEEFDYPIYSLDPKGRYAISLNFSRLGRLRPGYGYSLLPDPTVSQNAPNDDGLFLHDKYSKTRKLIVRISDLAQNNDPEGSVHYLNHSTFSPDGNRIVFFHIWNLVSGKRRINLYCYSLKSGNYSLIEGSRVVSHYCWIDSKNILASTMDSNCKMKLTIYDVENNTRQDVFDLINGDTHPMVSPTNANLFVIDSYPDQLWNQNLCLFNLRERTIKKISSFYSPRMYRGQVRCDLHPRWDRQGKFIVVDSADKGRRRMYLLSI